MRPTPPTASGMPTGKHYIGWWGDMGGPKQKGITQYAVSPFVQKPMKNVLQHSLFQGYKRVAHQVPYWILPFAAMYFTVKWAASDNEYRNSKAGHKAGHLP